MSPVCSLTRPTTECILVVSKASSKVIGGKILGKRLASMVFPAPGGPIKIMLCPPAAAISIQRFMDSCPLTSEKSNSGKFRLLLNSSSTFMMVCSKGSPLSK